MYMKDVMTSFEGAFYTTYISSHLQYLDEYEHKYNVMASNYWHFMQMIYNEVRFIRFFFFLQSKTTESWSEVYIQTLFGAYQVEHFSRNFDGSEGNMDVL